MYFGLIIKESILNEQILDKLDVVGVELWKTDNNSFADTKCPFPHDGDGHLFNKD